MRLRLSICLLLVLILGLFFSGCSNRPATTEPIASTQETATDTPETTGPPVPEDVAAPQSQDQTTVSIDPADIRVPRVNKQTALTAIRSAYTAEYGIVPRLIWLERESEGTRSLYLSSLRDQGFADGEWLDEIPEGLPGPYPPAPYTPFRVSLTESGETYLSEERDRCSWSKYGCFVLRVSEIQIVRVTQLVEMSFPTDSVAVEFEYKHALTELGEALLKEGTLTMIEPYMGTLTGTDLSDAIGETLKSDAVFLEFEDGWGLFEDTAPTQNEWLFRQTAPKTAQPTAQAAPEANPSATADLELDTPQDSTSPEVVSTPDTPSEAPEVDSSREVMALVNGYPAYRDEFDQAKNALLNQYSQTYAQFGMDIATLLAGADGRLFELGVEAEAFMQVTQRLLTQQEADQQGIVITDEDVQQDFDSQYSTFLASQGWTEEELALYLAPQGRTVESFKEDARAYIANQLLAMAVQLAVAGPLNVTDQQIEEYFAENESSYGTAEQVRASHILVETREEAEEILELLNEGADFAELARERSTDPGSGVNGGDLNWFGRGAMVGPFEEAVFALEIGETSEIVESEYGFHIIRLTDRQDATLPELADVIDQVQADLENELSYDLAIEWYNDVFSAAVLEIDDPLLDAIIKQTDDIDMAIEILEQAQSDGTSDDPYLPFVLGTFYERKVNEALEAKTAAESGTEDNAPSDEEIAAFDAQVVEYRTKALAVFRLAQESVGEDPGIRSKINEIEALESDPEEAP